MIRRMIVDLKAEHPAFNDNEITNIVYVRTGRRLGDHTAARVLSQEVVPLKLSRLFEPHHKTLPSRERRGAVVALHLDGWSVKSIASYLKVGRKTGYRVGVELWKLSGAAIQRACDASPSEPPPKAGATRACDQSAGCRRSGEASCSATVEDFYSSDDRFEYQA